MARKVSKALVNKGWNFEALLEHKIWWGEKIFPWGKEFSKGLEALAPASAAPPLDEDTWGDGAPDVTVPPKVLQAMQYLIHLLDHFADQVHLLAEETMLEVAVACGMPAADGRWVKNQHDQARACWASMNVAWQRILTGDKDDRWFAIVDFYRSTQAFVFLFKYHAVRENDWMYPTAGAFFRPPVDGAGGELASHSQA